MERAREGKVKEKKKKKQQNKQAPGPQSTKEEREEKIVSADEQMSIHYMKAQAVLMTLTSVTLYAGKGMK